MPRGSVCFLMIIVPQLEMLIGIGATKSFSSEPNELPEDRLLSHASPRWKHVPAGKTLAAVRSTAASPNVESTVVFPPWVFESPARVRGLFGGLLSVTPVLLTEASAKPEAVRSTPLLQQFTFVPELTASQSALGVLV